MVGYFLVKMPRNEDLTSHLPSTLTTMEPARYIRVLCFVITSQGNFDTVKTTYFTFLEEKNKNQSSFI